MSSRKERGKVQKLYLIERLPYKSNYEKNYIIMGSTGNIYQVDIKDTPACSCPDYQTRFNRCKHIYFVLIRIMRVKSSKVDQESYTKSELKKMFQSIPKIIENVFINHNIKKVYDSKYKDKILNKDVVDKGADDQEIEQKSTDDLCPICLDDLENGEELDYCKYSCGKPIHKDCFLMWVKKKSNECVFCRQSWTNLSVDKQKYINLLDN